MVIREGALRPSRGPERPILAGLGDIQAKGKGVHVGRAGGCVAVDVVVDAVAGGGRGVKCTRVGRGAYS